MLVHEAMEYRNQQPTTYRAYDPSGKEFPSWFVELHHLLLAGRKAASRLAATSVATQSATGSLATGRSTRKRGRRCDAMMWHVQIHMVSYCAQRPDEVMLFCYVLQYAERRHG